MKPFSRSELFSAAVLLRLETLDIHLAEGRGCHGLTALFVGRLKNIILQNAEIRD